jgi:hypothetical protein
MHSKAGGFQVPIGYMFVLHGSWTPYSSLAKEINNIHAHDDKKSHMWGKKISENRKA